MKKQKKPKTLADIQSRLSGLRHRLDGLVIEAPIASGVPPREIESIANEVEACFVALTDITGVV
jgi:hypothetical protein